MNQYALPDPAILKEMGSRIRQLRLNRNMTQQELALQAAVAFGVVRKMERGESHNILATLRVFRVLRVLDAFLAALPAPMPSPIQMAKLQGKARVRATAVRYKGRR